MRANGPDGMLIRIRRFAQVPDALIADPAVTDFAVRLWCRLDRYAGQDGRTFPHVDQIAEDMNVSSSKVDRGLRCLTDTGWIVRRRRGFSNVIDTYLTDEPVPPPDRRRTGRSETSLQVTTETSDLMFPETSDLVFPETSDLTFPKKENHSKESHLKEREVVWGGVSSHQRARERTDPPNDPTAGPLRTAARTPKSHGPDLESPPDPPSPVGPQSCPRHPDGNPQDEPCRTCRDVRAAHAQAQEAQERARAAREDALARARHTQTQASMIEAQRTAWRPPPGTLRQLARRQRERGA